VKILITGVILAGTMTSSMVVAKTPSPSGTSTSASAALTTLPAPAGESPAQASGQKEIKYWNIWADNQGKTHMTKCVLRGFKLAAFAPPAAPYLYGIAPEDIKSVVFSIAPVGWYGDWHHAPGPQWVVTLSGQWKVQTTDGSTLVQGPGEFQFNSDQGAFSASPGGHVGHTARQIGPTPNVRMIVTLKRMPGQSYTNQPCVL
jgi:hypothetical protein